MKVSPALFVRQVKQEVSKITWPSRSETTQGTMAVLFICALLAVLLFLIDAFFAFLVRLVVEG